jgi:hypothetical protein
LLTIDIGGEEFVFMVHTGAMVSLIKPNISEAQLRTCDVQARGVSGTQLDVSGEQEIEFSMRSGDERVTFVHTFVVSPLEIRSSGILGMDFLQRVGAELSLTARSLIMGRHTIPWTDCTQGVSTVRRLANEGREEPSVSSQEREVDNESVEEWVDTVELAETVTVPPLAGRIARCRVVRRGDLTDMKVPRKQVIMVEPEGLPGVYMARIVATLENYEKLSSTGARGSYPLVGKSSLVITQCVAGGDRKTGSGESQQELPDGSLLDLATSPERNEKDLRRINSYLPVENGFGDQVDTTKNN